MKVMKSKNTSSGNARGEPASIAIAVATLVLALLALFGLDAGVLAMIALLVLGSILILNDRSVEIEPHTILM